MPCPIPNMTIDSITTGSDALGEDKGDRNKENAATAVFLASKRWPSVISRTRPTT